MSKEIQSVILAGGRGKRMGELTQNRQKCMLPYEGKPILQHALDNLVEAFGSAEVIIALGYNGDEISNFFGSSYRTLNLHYVGDPRPLETRKRLLLAKEFVAQPFLLLVGDVIPPAPQMVRVVERFFKKQELEGILSGADKHSPALTHGLITILDGYSVDVQFPPPASWNNNQFRDMHIATYSPSFLDLAQACPHLLYMTQIVQERINETDQPVFGGEIYFGDWVHVATPEDLH